VICYTVRFAECFFLPNSSRALRADRRANQGTRRHCASFGGVAPGRYALVLFSRRKTATARFDRNWFGLPKEGYAFSNNVRPVFAPPSFKAAAFDYVGGAPVANGRECDIKRRAMLPPVILTAEAEDSKKQKARTA